MQIPDTLTHNIMTVVVGFQITCVQEVTEAGMISPCILHHSFQLHYAAAWNQTVSNPSLQGNLSPLS